LLARGGSFHSSEPQLDVLIALAEDAEDEVRKLAQQTLDRIPDSDCARLLADPALDHSVALYFLELAHLRPALLGVLLTNPAVPQEAIMKLVAKAGPGLISQLLTHLDLLKTSVLVALKGNPAYKDFRRRALTSVLATYRDVALDPIQEKKQVEDQRLLLNLITQVSGADAQVSRAAAAQLSRYSDEMCLNLLAAVSVEEPVARYFLTPPNIRPALLPLLLGHPDTPADAIVSLAGSAGPDVVPVLLDQLDLLRTPALMALKENRTYLLWQKEPPKQQGYVLEVDLLNLLIQEMESEKPPTVEELEAAFSEAEISAGEGQEQGSIVKKIARMKVVQRVKLALLGTREERSVLIRDTSRVVYRAVLSSPKVTESDVEGYAALKNVQQEVLRLIAMSRRFMKNYSVLKNIATNPRTPIEVSLPLLNRLLPQDLRAVAGSHDVPETLRKMAEKLIKSRRS